MLLYHRDLYLHDRKAGISMSKNKNSQYKSTVKSQFNDTAEGEAEIRMKNGIISAKMNSAITVVNTLSYIAILFAGALFVYSGLSDWGKVIALLSLKGTCDMLFVECGLFMAGMQTNVAGIKIIFEVPGRGCL